MSSLVKWSLVTGLALALGACASPLDEALDTGQQAVSAGELDVPGCDASQLAARAMRLELKLDAYELDEEGLVAVVDEGNNVLCVGESDSVTPYANVHEGTPLPAKLEGTPLPAQR